MSRRKLIIFDFDGTLADSFSWAIEAFDEAARVYGFDRIDRNDLDALRGLDARRILAKHRVPLWKVPAVGRHLRGLMQRDIAQIRLFPGIGAALQELSARGLTLALLTSNAFDNVSHVLGPEHLARFSHLECGSSLFGKARKLRKVLVASGATAREAILVGDEIRDALAAAQVGVEFGAVAWGYTRLEALTAHAPADTFETVADLVAKLCA